MEEDLEEEREIIEDDPRIRYMAVYALRSFSIKAEKWNKLTSTPDYKQCILDFLEIPEVKLLLILISPAGILATANTYPSNIYRKYSFFSKYEPMKVTMENFRVNLFWGDMVPNAMEGAAHYFEHIIGPMLADSKAVEDYPETTRRHMRQRALEIREVGIRLRGEQLGIKLLPLPLHTDPIHDYYRQLKADPRKAVLDYDYLNVLERGVITWHEMIHDIFKEDGSALLVENTYAKPDAEVKFWQVRLKQLENIFEQLKDELMVKISFILQTTNSVAFPMFVRAFKKTLIALSEARDIEKYLRPLLKYQSEVESTDFEENARLFKPLFHIISLVWVHSEHYSYPTKIVRLLRMFSNTMIAEAYKSLDTPTIYQVDFDEIYTKLCKVLDNMVRYRETFRLYQESELKKVYPAGKLYKPWAFHHTMIFELYDQHHERLKKIKKILESVLRFQKVDKLEVGGYAGNNSLSYDLKKSVYKFNKVIAKLRATPYDPADITEEKFERDYIWLQRRADDFEDRLVYVAKYYFDECHNYDAILKLFGLWGEYTVRPKFREVLEPMYDKLVEIFRNDVYDLEEFYIKNLHPWNPDVQPNIPMYWPPLAGTILWARMIRHRIDRHLEIIDSFTDPVLRKKVDSGEFNWERLIVERILHRLDELEHDRYEIWKENIDSVIQHELRKPFFKLSSRYVLTPNIRKKLEITMLEARYLKFLNIENVPKNVIKLSKRRELYRSWIRVIEETAKWYNAFRKDTRNEEFEIIYEEVKGIDKYIDNTIHKFNWGTKCNGPRIARLCNRCAFLGVRLALAQKNLREMIKISNLWNYAPLYHRPFGEFVDPGELLEYKDHNNVYKRYVNMEEAGEQIYDLIEENFSLLHNMPRVVGPSAAVSTISEGSKASGKDVVLFEPIFLERVLEEEGELDPEDQEEFAGRIREADEKEMKKLHEGIIPNWDADVDQFYYDLEQKLKKKVKKVPKKSRVTLTLSRSSLVRSSEARSSEVGSSEAAEAEAPPPAEEPAEAAVEGEEVAEEEEEAEGGGGGEGGGEGGEAAEDEEAAPAEKVEEEEGKEELEEKGSDEEEVEEEEEFVDLFAQKVESYEGIYTGSQFDVRSITIDVQRSIHKPLRPIMPLYRQKPRHMDDYEWETYLKKREFETFVRETAIEGKPIPYKEYEEKIILADHGPLPHFERSNPLLAKPREPIVPTESSEDSKSEKKLSEEDEDDAYDLRKNYSHPYQFAAALNRDWKRTRGTPRPRLDPLLYVPGLPPREKDIDYDALFTEVNEDEIPLEASSSDLDCGEEPDFSGLYPDEELIAGKIPRDFFRKADDFLKEFEDAESVDLAQDLTEEISTLDLFAEMAKVVEPKEKKEEKEEPKKEGEVSEVEGGGDEAVVEEEEEEEAGGLAEMTDKWNKFIEKRCEGLRDKIGNKMLFGDEYVIPYDSVTSLFSVNTEIFSVSTELDSQTTVTPSVPSTFGSYSTTPRASEDSVCSLLSRIEPKTESQESSEPTVSEASSEAALIDQKKSEEPIEEVQPEEEPEKVKLSLEPTPSLYEEEVDESGNESDLLDDPRCEKIVRHLSKRPGRKNLSGRGNVESSSSGRTYSDIQLYAASVPPYGFDRKTPSCSSSYASSFIFTSTPSATSETETDELPSAVSPIEHKESEAYTSTPSTLSDTVDESVKPFVCKIHSKARKGEADEGDMAADHAKMRDNKIRKALVENIQRALMETMGKDAKIPDTKETEREEDTGRKVNVVKIPWESIQIDETEKQRKTVKKGRKVDSKRSMKQNMDSDIIKRETYESKMKETIGDEETIDKYSSEEEKYMPETKDKADISKVVCKSFKRPKQLKAFIRREKYGRKIKKVIKDELENLAGIVNIAKGDIKAETVESSVEQGKFELEVKKFSVKDAEDVGKTVSKSLKRPKKEISYIRRDTCGMRLKGLLTKELQSIAEIREVALKSIEAKSVRDETITDMLKRKPKLEKYVLKKKRKLLTPFGKVCRKRIKIQKKTKDFTKRIMRKEKQVCSKTDDEDIISIKEEKGNKEESVMKPMGWKCLKGAEIKKGIVSRIKFAAGTKKLASQMKEEAEKPSKKEAKGEAKEKLVFFDEILKDDTWKYENEESIKVFYPPEFVKFGVDNPEDVRYDPGYKFRKEREELKKKQDILAGKPVRPEPEEKWYKGDPELVYQHLAERFAAGGKEFFDDILNEESVEEAEEEEEEVSGEETAASASIQEKEEEDDSPKEEIAEGEVPYIEVDRGETSSSTGISSTNESTMKTVSICSVLRKYAKKPRRRAIWDRYIELIDAYVKEGLLHAVGASVFYIDSEMNNERNNGPLFEVRMKVIDAKLSHDPSLVDDENKEGTFICEITSILKNINSMTLMIPRISYYQRHRTYLDEVLDHQDIMDAENRIIMRSRLAMLTARNYSANFERFSYLWTEVKEIHLRQFLKFSRILTPEETEIEDACDEYGTRLIRLDEPNLDKFRKKIDHYEAIYRDLLRLKEEEVIDEWFRLSYRVFKKQILNFSASWAMLYKQHLIDQVWNSVTTFDKFVREASIGLSKPLAEGDYEGLVKIMGYLRQVDEYRIKVQEFFVPIAKTMEVLKSYGHIFPLEIHGILQTLPDRWERLKKKADRVQEFAGPLIVAESETIKKRISLYGVRLDLYLIDFLKKPFWLWDSDAYYEIDKANEEVQKLEQLKANLDSQANLFHVEAEEMPIVIQLRKELILLKIVWDYVFVITSMINDWEGTKWRAIDSESMDMDLKRLAKELRALDKIVRNWEVFLYVETMVKNLITALRAITDLQNPAVKPRHWAELMAEVKISLIITDDTTLKELLSLNLHKFEEEVKTVVDKSVKEQQIEKLLGELEITWASVEFEYDPHPRTGLKTLRISEEAVELLEDNQVQVQNMASSKFVGFYQKQVLDWQKKLSDAEQMISVWMEVQRIWRYLESIFIESEDIRRTLPEDTKLFDQSDALFRSMMKSVEHVPNVVQAAAIPNILTNLNILIVNLQKCEKALTHYLDTKKLVFPRFYFLSNNDLMDILANSMQPELVCKHLSKLYDAISNLNFKKEGNRLTKTAFGMWAKDGEYCDLFGTCDLVGAVENYLNSLTIAMVRTVRENFRLALIGYEKKPRHEWIFDFPAQAVMVIVQIMWAAECGQAFKLLGEGHDNALKDYNKKQIWMLSQLINVMLGDLTDDNRLMITAICTIEVHSRDIVAKMILAKVGSAKEFAWQSQLRHRWDLQKGDCFINICDAQFLYQYEYFGNQPRLVITPLTDRCYITLTQSLHLVMGGAPAGPAGTGKTETTKDLSKGLGIMIYVFNCSEQMDYRSVGNIYKGLSQTGAWGCFDEFNRISVEVLSVVAVQVKSVLDAIKTRKSMFNFQGEIIRIVWTVGMFITMNPGYAGRAELPENLKALFRPCAMVVPDFDLICENMLIGEAFQEARVLGKKFITLYELCKELLSKQDHYDWGLRAIKSVLRVAGSLRRGDIERPEDQVLMRALRDFNIPKIVTDDRSIFMGLIGDLFPALDVPRKRDYNFEKLVYQGALDMKLQPEDGFILKIVQLVELFAVRHSVFIIGIAGTGKSCVWKTLHRTYANMKLKPHYNDLEPKAVTNDELFGIINPSTREWKDGLFSVLLRDQANMAGPGPKWMVMDGDIDPMWIESLNTVMDDNKVLTLASNERIALTSGMRLLFEISNLRTATPATVSRAGILFINPTDLGWRPYVRSWLDRRNDEANREMLDTFFEKYVPNTLIASKKIWKIITPIPEIAHIHMLCSLLDLLYTPANVPKECPKEHYEIYFVFSCCWAFGSACHLDQMGDNRVKFSTWWVGEYKTIKFPETVTKGTTTVFHYYIEDESKRWAPWTERIKPFTLDYDIPLQQTLVSTAETTRVRFFLDLLISNKKPIMLIAPAGCGKSVLIGSKMSALSEDYAVTNIAFNFYTTSEMLQKVLEKQLEKKAGRNYGPPGNKTMIYFIDDLNMPEVDKYGTVQPHTLIRQHMDYQHWYDRVKLSLKDIHNIMFVSCMNPTAGSFTVDSRLQRHFAVFALSFPTVDALKHIYSNLLGQHLFNPNNRFKVPVMQFTDRLLTTALSLHFRMQTEFLPTAIKFHYIFNLRDLSNVFQSILMTTAECISSQGILVRVWMHEATRIYGDKLVSLEEQKHFDVLLREAILKNVPEIPEDEYLKLPRMYCHFAEGIGDPKYMEVHSWASLFGLLTEAMENYSELIATMNLVLFEDAMAHICRINRVMEMPRGNALLVGVGGSGKQSLSRLSAFISSLEAFQIQLTKGYGTAELKADLAGIYVKTGLKNVGMMFLMTDSQIPDERFLVLINDMLSSGEIPELFADDEIDVVVQGVAPEAKSAGIPETKEACWKFFIDRVRRNLKTILSFSPVGSTLRVRARKFPALVNCTTIDWFMEWPQSALESVSLRFLEDVEELPGEIRKSMSLLMAFYHTIVNQMSETYRNNEKRYNYTTPKSFLELIGLYRKLLKQKTTETVTKIGRLENGLDKLVSCSEQVAGLKEQLAVQGVIVAEKNKKASELITVVAKETDIVSKEKKFAKEEERKCQIIEEDVRVKQKMCEDDLAKAMPALEAAQAALNTLNKTNLTEMKSFGTPPAAVANVAAAVLVLQAKKGKIPRDRSWKACKAMMGSADAFLSSLVNYNKENIHPDVVKAIIPYIKDPEFTPENVITKSSAAAGLCAWVINIMKFHEVWMVVLPKKKAEAAAKAELAAARAKLAALDERINFLEAKLAILTDKFELAMAEKNACQAEEDKTKQAIDLANRLVNGLASENVRWRQTVAYLKETTITLPGDIILVTAFISYVGCFTRKYREDMMNKYWRPRLSYYKPPIPFTGDLDPLTMLTDDAQIAAWNNEGLPSDRMSSENATILMNSDRWPLMIDPQLQGIKWIKTKYGTSLLVIRLGQKFYLDKIEMAVADGRTMLIENIGEYIDPVLDNLLSRNLIRKGKVLKIGDREIDYNPKFRLIFQTKLANPHYQPEIQAQTTLINFTVTRDGLEDQLLAEVVKAERPDLEKQKSQLTKQQNNFKIQLKLLEDELLQRLSAAGPDILSDRDLVEKLESTKKTAESIAIKVEEAKVTTVKIDIARESYRIIATRASILYFILNELNKINLLYQFSLKAFSTVFQQAIQTSQKGDTLEKRVENLIENITFCVFMYTSRGLFECDKLIFMCQMAIQILLHAKEIIPQELDFLLKYPYKPNVKAQVPFLTDVSWGGVAALVEMEEFANLDTDIVSGAERWKKWVDGETPEKDKFPQEWSNKSSFQQLLIIRSLRPDRMTYALRIYIQIVLGEKYISARTVEFEKSFQETTPQTAVFFILSAGVDPTRDVERLGNKMGFTTDKQNFHNISLGQGQEPVAEEAIQFSSENGHWVILQNIHLVARWLPTLDKKMEQAQENPHPNFRLYLSSEPSADPLQSLIPQGVLESSIKITNEPPTGMMANLHKALENFNQATLDMCSKESEFKAILFALCYFHAVVAERRKFGPQGWNRSYPFNVGDLTISVMVLHNYLENNVTVPWVDLRYLFGEIMYGGHITDDRDRRLCRTYLEVFLDPALIEGEHELAPGFQSPPNSDYQGYHRYIDAMLPPESPVLYGLHLNAEIGFLTTQAAKLFKTLMDLQPRDTGEAKGTGPSREDQVNTVIDTIMSVVKREFLLADMMSRMEEATPYNIVALQECERMNMLTGIMQRTLKELALGLKGELTITSDMENLEQSIVNDTVPENWSAKAYPSQLGLMAWFADLETRIKELDSWTNTFRLPNAVWLGGLFNPNSFLTAIMQMTARKNEWPLDKMCLHCEVLKKKNREAVNSPREGSNICNLYMEGARWDIDLNSIAEAILKDMYPLMPVIFVKAITQDKQDLRGTYECPVYKTVMRGPTYVQSFHLKTKERASKWILGGVGLLLSI